MKRLSPWQQEKQRTAKALRELVPPCATPNCKGRATGYLLWQTATLCPRCQFAKIQAQRAAAPRET